MSESVRVSMPPIFALGLLSPEERRQREIRAEISRSVLAEREACAKIADDMSLWTEDPSDVAASIRARAKQESM